MKQRISSLDLQILSKELKKQLEGYRLSNIYNIADSSRQFLLKFGKPDSKLNVIIDCGLRIHLTEFSRPIPPTPSGFVVKLRKHLKSKRLTTVKRVNNDRILVLSFSDGMYFLVLEFFSAGNVILLDSDRKIIALQRIVHEYENKVGHKYEMFDDKFLDDVKVTIPDVQIHTESSVSDWIEDAAVKASAKSIGDRKKSAKIPSIHKLLFIHAPHLSSDLISRNLKKNGYDPSSSCLDYQQKLSSIVDLLDSTEKEVHELLSADSKVGYIVTKKNINFDPTDSAKSIEYIYEQFHPFDPFIERKGNAEVKIIEVKGDYNKTVDNYFSTIESSKYALRIQNQEQLAKKRLTDARLENEKRIQALRDVQSSNEQKGHLIIANADLVEEAQSAVRGLVEQQMDWNTIEKMIANEQMRKNRVALLIQLPLDLKNNKITLKLPSIRESADDSSSEESSGESDSSDSELSDFETEELQLPSKSIEKNSEKNALPAYVNVVVDFTLSSFANASNYFNIKKSTLEKQKKVEKNASKALKNIELKIEKDLQKKLKESHETLRKTRKQYFFEKYNWFLSNEGFLVIMGKSGAETDQIYCRYITDRDVYISNSFGIQAWIKNPDGTEIPPNTLMQAGVMCMCASPAWSKKIQSSPWWCFAANLSKFDAVDGSVLPIGAFRIKEENQKVFLPPAQLVMGFSFLWKVKVPGSEDLDSDSEEVVNDVDEDESNRREEKESERSDDKSISEKLEMAHIGDTESTHGSAVSETGSDLGDNEVLTPNNALDASSSNSTFQNINRNIRGKRGKLKKIQKKYADQDEEERMLRLEALGTLKGIEKEQKKTQETLIKQHVREVQNARREKQKQIQALKFNESEKVNIDYNKIFSGLKPSIGKDDELLGVIPCFGPWSALTKYKYKVKIQPGAGKKTKSLTEILHYFNKRRIDEEEADRELDWPREHELIKQLKPAELVPLIYVDKLKLVIPGQPDSKKGKSNGAKSKKGASK
ncbi:LAFE_0B06788g1_1 [Lachancea fermentati]|uniref:Ribosome quality control complex subunit 2 n=1 Tax=Lachancea fermentati TaxID=4955 RepID=A0A1G4M804_LACFM|nr:LAFE_0B06788g1_1 [Lachancea fermentati]